MSIRPIAIHLPQFHPFPENDLWWGKGFTEWRNVAKARPTFKGHYQPHIPSDLGFYDLRLEESRIAQAALAKEYGIYGFCYYHYWFNGKRLMHRPVDDMISTRTPDFPFMLCWANENWNRTWDGDQQTFLIRQEYSPSDDIEHIRFLCKHVFTDPRYIRVDGKPFFVIYRPKLFPDIKETIRTWRREAIDAGIGEIYLGYMQGFRVKDDPASMGFDTAVDFQPDFYAAVPRQQGSVVGKALERLGIRKNVYADNEIRSYRDYVEFVKLLPAPDYKRFPCITPMWDNTARRKSGAFILKDEDPAIYEDWLTHILQTFRPPSAQENFVFINAWNEWAEGNHLEPCLKWGRAYLEATKNAFENAG